MSTLKPGMEEEIDSCRCHGQWQKLPKLAKKISKYPNCSVLEQLIYGEHSLNVNLNLRRKHVAYDSDNPSHLSYEPPIPKDSLMEAQNYLKKAIENGNNDNSVYTEQAKILLARSNLEIGEIEEALKLLNEVNLNDDDSQSEFAYTKIGVIMGWTLKGLSHELSGNKHDAIDCYNNVVSIVEKQLSSQTQSNNDMENQSITTSDAQKKTQDNIIIPDSISEQWVDWSEEALYRAGLLTYSKGDVANAEKIFKLYNTVVSLCKELPQHKKFKPIPINKYLIDLLLKPYKDVESPVAGIPVYSSNYSIPQALYRDLYPLLSNYEELVCNCQLFPKGEDATRLEIERNERIIECYKYWTILECGVARKTEAEVLEKKKKLLEILYRGTRHTYQSLAILRWIVHTFTYMVVNFGDNLSREDKREAMASIVKYIEYFEKIFETLKITEKKKQEELESMVVTPSIKKRNSIMSQDAWGSPTTDSPISSLVIKNVEGESLTDMVGVVIACVRVALEIAEGDINIIMVALKNVDKALKLYNNIGENLSDYRQTLTKLLQYRGIIYGELALEIRDNEKRNEYSNVAINSFELCIRYDKKQWDVYYQLALQKAEMLEISSAIEYLNRSITINPDNVPSWNLLALLCSAQGNVTQALKVCEIGWKTTVTKLTQLQASQDYQKDGDESNISTNVDSLSALESIKTKSKFRWDLVSRANREELISFKVTHFLLHVKHFGAQESVKLLQSLFSLYMKLFVTNNIPGVGEVVAPEINDCSSIRMQKNELSVQSGYDNMDMNTYSIPYNQNRGLDSVSFSAFTSNQAPNYSPYHFRQLDLLITLWIISSNISRQLGSFNEAYKAIMEAKRLAKIMGHIEYQNRNKGSSIFTNNKKNEIRSVKPLSSSASVGTNLVSMDNASYRSTRSRSNLSDVIEDGNSTVGGNGNGGSDNISLTPSRIRRTNSAKSAISLLGIAYPAEVQKSDSPWEITSNRMRRVIADLEFERIQIQYDQYKRLRNKVKKPNPIYDKYLRKSKMFDINIDQFVNENSETPVTPMNTVNIPKESSSSEVKIILTPSEETNEKGTTTSTGENQVLQGEAKVESPTQLDDNNQKLNVTSNAIKRPPVTGDLRIDEEDKEDEEEKEVIEPKSITLESLIDQLNNVSIIDDDHLPTRVLLGRLYYQTKNYELAEYWLQRSVKNNKNRGANGCKSGETTYYGGITGSWGWEGWHWLGMSYKESNMGKENQAIKCLQYAVDLEHLSQPRGFECMSKFCPL
ncbi:TPR-like protein [Piromyces finnis]|uniref:TPR-like protein n=1 Tax=Piromyces finnis TaxID=1754191 RepID=A0A1Y1UWI2_9FUNG|nr:TPR-like protein [Piromyces finnis]|eukprot:ORX41844.1 TPR-like protein [Piromyces finnis]